MNLKFSLHVLHLSFGLTWYSTIHMEWVMSFLDMWISAEISNGVNLLCSCAMDVICYSYYF